MGMKERIIRMDLTDLEKILKKQDTIDKIATDLGAKRDARLQWRNRGIPASWRLKILEASLKQRGGIKLADFEDFEGDAK